ncbi:MAG: prolyl oligopeptidase family serine peptidase [Lentisphaeria bacterium]|nr:prolyl oligopeptidase family serine peptidase [Lentisphaeria bacterium]
MREKLVVLVLIWGLLLPLGQACAQEPAAREPDGRAAAVPAAGVHDLESALAPFQALDWRPANAVERTLVPYAMLQLRKARLAEGKAYLYQGSSAAASFVRQGLAALSMIPAGKPYQARPGKLTEAAYLSCNDRTAQPYYVYLPRAYDPAKKWPMLVFLHGYVPSISVLDPWILGEDSYETADRNGFILLTPYGRRNTDFQGVGEVDVFEATREAVALYSVDPERIHLTGVSMGGAGCYYIGLRRPGLYAAFTAMDAQSDMHTWWPLILRDWPADRADLLPFRRWLVEWDNPVDLAMNARNQRFFILHGENDPLVSAEQSRTFVKLVRDLGVTIDYYEVPDAGHYIYWEPEIFEKAWSWHRPLHLERSPRRVTFKTFSLEYDRAFWCRIGDFIEWGVPAVVDVSVSEDGAAVTAQTTNVRTLVLDARTAPVRTGDMPRATVNGKTAETARDPSGNVVLTCGPAAAPAPAWPPRKRRGLCGPVEEAFDTAFVVVQGTSGTAAQSEALRAMSERWLDEWDRFADGRPPLLLDSQVTDAVLAGHNLVLFGTPETNGLLARLHDRLPIRIGDHRFEVAGRVYEGADLGLVFCYPNPLNPERYVVVYSGELYGERCGVNHKHDLIPDFLVFNTRAFSFDDTNQHEVAGFFDLNWNLSPKLTWVREHP